MTYIPLVFRFRVAVLGDGGTPEKAFSALVTAKGRILVHRDDDGWFASGVHPGGMGSCGATPAEAWAAFRQTFEEVMFDCASEADFATFKSAVEEIFTQVDDEDQERWDKAAEAIRGGVASCDVDMERVDARSVEAQASVEVLRLDAPVGEVVQAPNVTSGVKLVERRRVA